MAFFAKEQRIVDSGQLFVPIHWVYSVVTFMGYQGPPDFITITISKKIINYLDLKRDRKYILIDSSQFQEHFV